MQLKGIIILTFCLSIFSMSNIFAEIPEKDVLKSIKEGDTDVLTKFLDEGANINMSYGKDKITLLNYAIKSENLHAVKLLILRGADPNIQSKGKTPLVMAVTKKNLMILHELIESGADLDATVKKGNTALIYAAKSGKMGCVRMLVENGADVEWKNNNGLTALDFANMANLVSIAEYLVKIIEMRHYYKGLPNYTDGPHMEWQDDSTLKMFYMTYDTSLNYPIKKGSFFIVTKDTFRLQGFNGDSGQYTVIKEMEPDLAIYENVSKILAIGDIHGHHKALVAYLQNNEIIDENLNWTWGDGHIVMLGDVFDRGNEVTESLWLIYELDLKARMHGGRVHMLLGNHEVMVMLNDTRYLNRKYELFSKYFLRDYADFYGLSSVLGHWLRTRNTIIKINDCIFSHAGISPFVLDKQLSIDSINFLISDFLHNDPQAPNKNAGLTQLLINNEGPLWYRGYVMDGMGSEKISQNQVNSILKYYKANRMIIAHTEVKSMQSFYDGKVIAIDIPIRTKSTLSEALLIEEGNYFRLTSDREKLQCNYGLSIGHEE